MVFSDWRQEPTTSDALQMAGWTWSGTIPWIKPTSRPRKGGPKQDSEFIAWGVKGSLDQIRDLYLPGHYIASQPRKDRVHITQKPVEIMQQLVQVCPEGGTVLDPFTGSGSTGVAALSEGRKNEHRTVGGDAGQPQVRKGRFGHRPMFEPPSCCVRRPRTPA